MALRSRRPTLTGLQRGEKVLAVAGGPDGEIVATTLRLVLPERRLGWQEIERASWDRDAELLEVVEARAVSPRPVRHRLRVSEPGRLLDVVREQVTASVVIDRHVSIDGRRGVRVTGRRPPGGAITWTAAVDAGLRTEDHDVKARLDAAVAMVRSEVE